MHVPLPAGFDVGPIVAELSAVDGMAAVVLGGSWAAGRQRPDSDVDLGLCYRADRPLDVEAVREIARRLDDSPDPVVTDLGIWGPWVNGGAWLTIKGQRVDFIYRDLDFMVSTIDEWLAGRGRSDYWQQAPYGSTARSTAPRRAAGTRCGTLKTSSPPSRRRSPSTRRC